MNGSIICHLILKDWRLNRLLILLTIGAGIVAMVVAQYGHEIVRVVGGIWLFVALCVLASMLPASVIINERKKQTLAFIISLPVSAVQYTIAKIASVWGLFLLPWFTLLIMAAVLIETSRVVPRGAIPMLLMFALLPLIGFCIISSTALVAESEGWLIAASVVINSSYWLGFYLLSHIPALTANWNSPVAVWNQTAVFTLSAELGSIALIFGITLFLQSRKRTFI
ncbi:MAG: hypothetical protein ACRD4Q_12000 [Candidatus Acidiferrales bacterium]